MATFDIEAARNAGATDEQIMGFLSDKVGFDLPSAMSAGATDDQLLSFLLPKFNEKVHEERTGFMPHAKSALEDIIPKVEEGVATGAELLGMQKTAEEMKAKAEEAKRNKKHFAEETTQEEVDKANTDDGLLGATPKWLSRNVTEPLGGMAGFAPAMAALPVAGTMGAIGTAGGLGLAATQALANTGEARERNPELSPERAFATGIGTAALDVAGVPGTGLLGKGAARLVEKATGRVTAKAAEEMIAKEATLAREAETAKRTADGTINTAEGQAAIHQAEQDAARAALDKLPDERTKLNLLRDFAAGTASNAVTVPTFMAGREAAMRLGTGEEQQSLGDIAQGFKENLPLAPVFGALHAVGHNPEKVAREQAEQRVADIGATPEATAARENLAQEQAAKQAETERTTPFHESKIADPAAVWEDMRVHTDRADEDSPSWENLPDEAKDKFSGQINELNKISTPDKKNPEVLVPTKKVIKVFDEIAGPSQKPLQAEKEAWHSTFGEEAHPYENIPEESKAQWRSLTAKEEHTFPHLTTGEPVPTKQAEALYKKATKPEHEYGQLKSELVPAAKAYDAFAKKQRPEEEGRLPTFNELGVESRKAVYDQYSNAKTGAQTITQADMGPILEAHKQDRPEWNPEGINEPIPYAEYETKPKAQKAEKVEPVAQEETVTQEPVAQEETIPEDNNHVYEDTTPSENDTGHTVESLKEHMTPEMRKMVDSGKAVLHDTHETLPSDVISPETVKGLVTPEGVAHFVASKLTPENLHGVFLHEVGVHAGMAKMLGPKVWENVKSQVLTQAGKPFEEARKAVPSDTPDHLKAEETIAYLVEHSPNLPIVKRIVAAIRNFARQHLGANLKVTEHDLRHLAEKAIRHEAKSGKRTTREGTAYSYVGKKAKGADKSAFDRATKMEKEGVDSESIRKDTGWFVGHDNKWRFEVDDRNADFKQDFKDIPKKTNLTLGEIFDNPELYKQYPEAANITFEVNNPFFDWSKSSQGWYDESRNKIVVTPYAEDPRSTMLHEMQHWVQAKEGFAPGGNYNSVKNYDENLLDTLEKHIRNDANKNEYLKKWEQDDIGKVRKSLSEINILHKELTRLENINSKLDKIKNDIDEKMKSIKSKTLIEYEEKYKSIKDRVAKNRVSIDALREEYYELPYDSSEREHLRNKIDALDDENHRLNSESLTYLSPYAAIRELNSKHEAQLSRLRELKYKAEDDIREHGKKLNALVPDAVKHKVYQLISGEVEARDVEARKDFTPEQRKETTPYTSQGVAKEDAIVLGSSSSKAENRYSRIPDEAKALSETGNTMQRPEKEEKKKTTTEEFVKKYVDNLYGLTKTLDENLPDYFHAGKFRADKLLHDMSQAMNKMNHIFKTGMYKVNDDGTVGVMQVPVKMSNGHTRNVSLETMQDQMDKLGSWGREAFQNAAFVYDKQSLAKRDPRKLPEKYRKDSSLLTKEVAMADALVAKHPEIRDALNSWHALNKSNVDGLYKSGLISPQQHREWSTADFYMPNFVLNEEVMSHMGVEKAEGIKVGNTMTKVFRERTGDEHTINAWENMAKHITSCTLAVMANEGKKAAAEQLTHLGNAHKVDASKKFERGNFAVMENGKRVFYKLDDPSIVPAMVTIHNELGGLFKLALGTSRLISLANTNSPKFWLSELIRNPIQASLTNDLGWVTPVDTMKYMISPMSGRKKEITEKLKSAGVIGVIHNTVDPREHGEFIKNIGKGAVEKGSISKGKTKVINALNKTHVLIDAATKVNIYEMAFKKAKKDFNYTDAQANTYAIMKARESFMPAMRGNSEAMQNLKYVMPFLASQIFGIEQMRRAAMGAGVPKAQQKAFRRKVASKVATAGFMAGALSLYFLNNAQYQAQGAYDTLPFPTGAGDNDFVNIPLPKELSFIKWLPEMMMQYSAGTRAGDAILKSATTLGKGMLPAGIGETLVPIPAFVKIPAEVITNYNFHTGRGIETPAELTQPVANRGENRVARAADWLSKHGGAEIGLSPAKIEYIAKGLGGQLVGVTMWGMDNVLPEINDEIVERPSTDIWSNPVLFGNMIPNPNKSVYKSDFYDEVNRADEIHAQAEKYKKAGDREAYNELINSGNNRGLYKVSTNLNRIKKEIGDLNKQINAVKTAPNTRFTPERRKELIDKYTQMANQKAKIGNDMYRKATGQ